VTDHVTSSVSVTTGRIYVVGAYCDAVKKKLVVNWLYFYLASFLRYSEVGTCTGGTFSYRGRPAKTAAAFDVSHSTDDLSEVRRNCAVKTAVCQNTKKAELYPLWAARLATCSEDRKGAG